MTNFAGKRIRDPVHGLIVFEEGNPRDELAWALLNTPEMQRLRRIRQLGVSEFVYPGATHSRFAHSVGVYHCAKQLSKIIHREFRRQGKEEDFDQDKADDAILAALLHDIGHGPFSHAFEGVQHSLGRGKRHELWSAEIIRNEKGEIARLLGEERAERIASMLAADDPQDIYHAIFSSSFDADRLDYIQRDRMMTGTGAGAIDFDWLMHNLRIAPVNVFNPEIEGGEHAVDTFCFDRKALPAAEQFLYSRYTMHEQVYFHKVTRCVEHMLRLLLKRVAHIVQNENAVEEETGLPAKHPLVRFYASSADELVLYTRLDDLAILGALPLMAQARDRQVAGLASRLLLRDLYKTFDLAEVPSEHRQEAEEWLDEKYAKQLQGGMIIKDDEAKIGIYSTLGAGERKVYKRLHIMDGDRPCEVTTLSPMIKALEPKKSFIRYFFAEEAIRDEVRQRLLRGGGRA